jgi:hypothetical protein
MGPVYCALDRKLNRDVAIKVLGVAYAQLGHRKPVRATRRLAERDRQ